MHQDHYCFFGGLDFLFRNCMERWGVCQEKMNTRYGIPCFRNSKGVAKWLSGLLLVGIENIKKLDFPRRILYPEFNV